LRKLLFTIFGWLLFLGGCISCWLGILLFFNIFDGFLIDLFPMRLLRIFLQELGGVITKLFQFFEFFF